MTQVEVRIVGDGVTDEWQAFRDALDSLGSASNPTGGRITVPLPPSGRIRLSKPLHINRNTHIDGPSFGLTHPPCQLVFDPGIHGIIIDSGYKMTVNQGAGDGSLITNMNIIAAAKQFRDVHDAATEVNSDVIRSDSANFTAADLHTAICWDDESSAVLPGCSIVEVLGPTRVRIDSPARNTTSGRFMRIGGGCGLIMNGKAKLENLGVSHFAGHGVVIDTDIPNSNANGWMADFVWAIGNGGHGWAVRGGDSNAGMATRCLGYANGGWGFRDSCSAANTYIAPETGSNVLGGFCQVEPISGATVIGGYSEGEIARYGGNALVLGNGMGGGEVEVNTTYGRLSFNPQIGAFFSAPLRSTHDGRQVRQDGIVRGPIPTNIFESQSLAATSKDIGTWVAINDAGAPGFGGKHAWTAGQVVEVLDRSRVRLSSMLHHETSGLTWSIKRYAAAYGQVGGSAIGDAFRWGADDGGGHYQLNYDGGTDPEHGGWWNILTSAPAPTMSFSGAKAPEGAGHVRFPRGIQLGYATAMREVNVSYGPPTSGQHRRGAVFFEADPTETGPVMYVCIEGGTPGRFRAVS